MSWEEMSKSQTICPCGKGHIMQKHYGDDWNRFEDGPVVIECEDCKKKYKVEKETHSGRLNSDGFWNQYFLLPIDYPEYNGPSESVTYGLSANSHWNFTGWLIEHFTEEELLSAEEQLHTVKSSARLTGNAVDICKEHRRALKTVKVSAIRTSVEKAMSAYPSYVGNKKQREEVKKREEEARNIYREEKRKHRIAINFQ